MVVKEQQINLANAKLREQTITERDNSMDTLDELTFMEENAVALNLFNMLSVNALAGPMLRGPILPVKRTIMRRVKDYLRQDFSKM